MTIDVNGLGFTILAIVLIAAASWGISLWLRVRTHTRLLSDIKSGDFDDFEKRIDSRLACQTLSPYARELLRFQAFAAEAQKDPMSSAIDAHFNQYLFERGAASPEGGKQAARIAEAQGRFMQGQATRADCDVLKEHWEYVRGKLKAQTVPKNEEKVVQDAPVPPKTETPGTGRGAERRAALDVHKLGRMTAGQQLAALKRAGVLSMPK